jgi:hypothetical protein
VVVAATRDDIQGWLLRAKANGAAYVIVACDTYDWDDYPIEVGPDDDFYKKYANVDGRDMQRIVEVYDLSLDLGAQLNERRAYHPPIRNATPPT